MPVIVFLPGFRNSVLVQRLTVGSQPPPRWLFACRTVKPTTQCRLAVTSAWKVQYGIQSAGTCVVVRVGQRPPVKVSFRLCLPRVAFSVDSSIAAGGSFIFRSGNSRFDHA